MKKTKTYHWVKFSPEVILSSIEKLKTFVDQGKDKFTFNTLEVEFPREEWNYDEQAEFFADYRSESVLKATMSVGNRQGDIRVHYRIRPNYSYGNIVNEPITDISIQLANRAKIEEIFSIFESAIPECSIAEPDPPPKPPEVPWEKKVTVFIGHGQSPQWRDLKDHLTEKHGLKVEAYEIGARAGLTIKDILEDMLTKSSFAVLVMSAEDKDARGTLASARQCNSRSRIIPREPRFQKSHNAP